MHKGFKAFEESDEVKLKKLVEKRWPNNYHDIDVNDLL